MSDAVRAHWGPSASGWACVRCQHTLLVIGDLDGRPCPWCASAGTLSRADELVPDVAPEKVVVFSVDRLGMEQRLARTVDRMPRMVRPPDLTVKNLRTRLQPVFLPAWLVDSRVQARWHGEVGFDYDVKTHREQFEGGQWRSHEVHRTHIDWEPRAGTLNREIHNVDAPGVRGWERIDRAIGPFSAEAEVEYGVDAREADHVGRPSVVMPNLSQAQAWQQARGGFKERVRQLVMRACEGQHLDRFELEETHDGAHWTLRLLPVWTTWYRRHDGGVEVIRYSGQTGEAMGKLVASEKKAKRLVAAAAVISIGAALIAAFVLERFLVDFELMAARGGLYLLAFLSALTIPGTWRAGAIVRVLQDKPWLKPRR